MQILERFMHMNITWVKEMSYTVSGYQINRLHEQFLAFTFDQQSKYSETCLKTEAGQSRKPSLVSNFYSYKDLLQETV